MRLFSLVRMQLLKASAYFWFVQNTQQARKHPFGHKLELICSAKAGIHVNACTCTPVQSTLGREILSLCISSVACSDTNKHAKVSQCVITRKLIVFYEASTMKFKNVNMYQKNILMPKVCQLMMYMNVHIQYQFGKGGGITHLNFSPSFFNRTV